jgi:hypothetical protein
MRYKLAAVLMAVALTGCGMSPEMRRDVFWFDPASENVDWSPFKDRTNMGVLDEGRWACQQTQNRIITTNGVEDEYRYNDCQPMGPTDNPQRYGGPGPDQAPFVNPNGQGHPTEGLNNIPYPYSIENRY